MIPALVLEVFQLKEIYVGLTSKSRILETDVLRGGHHLRRVNGRAEH
jgi:hypothetical protein